MKTVWDLNYLHSKMSGYQLCKWRSQKLSDLKKKTGVAWCTYHSRGKQIFLPRWDDEAPIEDKEVSSKILGKAYSHGHVYVTTFLILHQDLGVPLPRIMGVTKQLVRRTTLTLSPFGLDLLGKGISFTVGRGRSM